MKVHAEDALALGEPAARVKPTQDMRASSDQLHAVDHAIKHSGKANEAIKRRASFATRNAGGSVSGQDDGKGIPNSMNITSVVDYANRIRKVSAGRHACRRRGPRPRRQGLVAIALHILTHHPRLCALRFSSLRLSPLRFSPFLFVFRGTSYVRTNMYVRLAGAAAR